MLSNSKVEEERHLTRRQERVSRTNREQKIIKAETGMSPDHNDPAM